MHRCNIVHILCCIYFPLYPPPTSQWPKVLSKVSLKEELWNLTHPNVKSIQVTCFGRTPKRSWQYSVILKENLHHQSANISFKVIFSLYQNILATLFSLSKTVFVHGHTQFICCNTNIEPCCEWGEICCWFFHEMRFINSPWLYVSLPDLLFVALVFPF